MRYNLAIARELPVFKPIPYVIEVDGVRHTTQAMLVAVGNGPSYGGGMRVCPDASFDDGLFDILIVHQISTIEFLKVFPKVFSGKHVGHPAVEILRGRQVRLEAFRHRQLCRRRTLCAPSDELPDRARRAERPGPRSLT